MVEPPSPVAQLRAFRAELHACCTRRADALFELGDALLSAEAFLAHLSLEAVHRRGWGSTDDALASGRIDAERLRDLLAECLPPADEVVEGTRSVTRRIRNRSDTLGGWRQC